MRLPSGLSNTARTRTVPLFAFTWLSTSCRWPANGVSPWDGAHLDRNVAQLPRVAAPARPQRAGDDLLVGIEARVDRVHETRVVSTGRAGPAATRLPR
jgi:hypothetical protein